MCLLQRYESNQIYTSINAMMLAINPYADLGLYAPSVVARYGQFGDGPPPPPHIFGVAAEAFKGMLAGGSQSILVAGESGAGKTESCRRVLQYLAHREGSRRPGAGGEGGEGGEGVASRGPATARSAQLHDELVRSNCVLEALGNARTVMNDNSSRFGKFLILQYGAGARLAGATVSTYLLEKTRVVRHAPSERSFHILYGLATLTLTRTRSLTPTRALALSLTPTRNLTLRRRGWGRPSATSSGCAPRRGTATPPRCGRA